MKKRYNPNVKSPKANFAGNTFYNYRNNDFLKTNAFLDHSTQILGSPEDLQLDTEAQLRILKNNQEISGNINAKKFSDKLHPSLSARNFSTPQLRPIDLTKVKGTNQTHESSTEVGFSSTRAISKKGVILTSPRYQLGSSQSFGLSPVTQVNSARVSTAAGRGMSENNVQKSIIDMTPEEIAALEKQVLAKTKLIRDKNQILSRMNTKSENKRDVSHISETPGKAFALPSPAPTQTMLETTREGRIRNTTPEANGRNTVSLERTPVSHFMKKNNLNNTNDVTIFEETKPSMLLTERRRAGAINKKATLDIYQNGPVLSANGSLPSLSGFHSNNETMIKTHTGGFMKGGESVLMSKRTMRTDLLADGSKVDQEDLISELRKELPSVLTSAPASRQEVIVLANWMDRKCKDINENLALKEEEKSIHTDKIYNVCINEVFRQVSLDCAERGELLYRIWMGYLQMFLQKKTGLDDEMQRLKAYYERENQKQYEWSQKLITKRDMEIEACKVELQKALKEKEEDDKQMDKVNKKNMQLKQKTEQLKSLLTMMKSQMEEIKEENRQYAKRQAYKIANNTKGTSVPTFLTHKENNKETTGPETLLLTGPTPKPGLVSSIAGFKTMADAATGSNSSDSDESSLDFVYEDALTKSKEVFKIDMLNTNALAYKTVTNIGSPHGPAGETITVIAVHTATKETQTGLQLMESKYDSVFETQKLLDELMSELKLKREVDVLAEAELLGEMEMRQSGEGSDRTSRRQSLMVGDSILEGEGDNTVKSIMLPSETKKKAFSEAGLLSPKSLMFNGEKGASKTINLSEDDKSPEARGQSIKMNSPNGKSTYLSVFEPIQELNEDAKSVSKSQRKVTLDAEDSLRRDTIYDINENPAPLFIPERRASLLTPVPKADGGSNTSQPKEANSSFVTDDPFHSLNDAASDSAEEEKVSMIEEDDPANKKAPSIGASFDIGHHNTSITGGSTLIRNLEGLELDSEGKRSLSIGTIANAKTHAIHMVAALHSRKEDIGVVDKAKLMTILRMYKVETQKNQALKNSIVELEEQIINEKETQTKLQENIGELNVHIKMLEALKAKCPHGKCYMCRGDKNDDFTEADTSKQNFESSVGDKASEADMQDKDLGEDGVDEDEEEGEDGVEEGEDEQLSEAVETQGDGTVKTTNRIRRTTRKKQTLTKGQQPEFAKKKQNNGNQIYSAALGILTKIKDKKLTKFKNFMPIKSVLKQINTLYNERISQAKENAVVKEEEFFVFVYKWFFNNFGFRKIAEQKYIIFVLSVKKYLHIVRINLFARFMSLLQGPSNFNVDEFNRYLEGVEFLHNSTLGSPIVNNETDSKMYTPFLRGLEYLRNFADNKMATDEYIEFKREFDAIKEADPKNINRNGIVDIDLFMTKVLTKYRIICNRTKQFVVNAFKAADLDGNKYCSLREFLVIYRNIEHDKYDEGFAENLFNEHADIKLQGEINLSFDKFTVVCVEYGLFSDLQQELFLGVQNSQEIEDKMRSLKNQWSLHYFEIDRKLSEAEKITKEEKQYWFSILKVLNERLTAESESMDAKPILIAFKILDQEVERLVDSEAERDMYGVRIQKFESKET